MNYINCPKRKSCIHTMCSRHQNTEKWFDKPVHESCEWYFKTNERIQKIQKLNNIS